jgi:hypothetical protein
MGRAKALAAGPEALEAFNAAHRERNRRYYDRHKARVTPAMRARWREVVRGRKIDLVTSRGGRCVDCGGMFHPAVFHFDHRDPMDKVANISVLLVSGKTEQAWSEAAKCDMVCANCHAVRTYDDPVIADKIRAARAR